MKNYLQFLSLVFISTLIIGCSQDNNVNPVLPVNTTEFPKIDNTNAMNVSINLTNPTNTDVRLDSMKVYYYENTAFYPNLPGASYRNQILTTPVAPIIFQAKHSFTYALNGFIDTRTVVFQGYYQYDNDFKFIFDYDHNDADRLQNVRLKIETNGEVIYDKNLEYTIGIEDAVLNQMQTNAFNILSYSTNTYVSPKNVFNPERNLLPNDVKLQYLSVLDTEIYNLTNEFNGLYEIVNDYFNNNLYINTHCTFLSNLKNQNQFLVSLDNLQYQVRSNHYPEIIQFGNLNSGGVRMLYYYKK